MLQADGFEDSQGGLGEEFQSSMADVSFEMMFNENDSYSKQFCQYTNRNHSWKTAHFQVQNVLIDLKEMTNVRYLVIDDFQYGCEMTISLSEFKSGPYIEIYKNKYFSRSNQKRINLSSLPTRFVQLNISKGVHIHLPSIRIVGIRSKDLAKTQGLDLFKVMVSGPQRIMYK